MQKQLQLLIDLLPEVTVIGKTDKIVTDVTADSRTVQKGSLFIALKGVHVDGHKFLTKAAEAGAVAALVEDVPPVVPEGLTLLQSKDVRGAMELIAPYFFDYPGKTMRMIGVTGTNGKTTSTNIIRQVLKSAGYKCGMIGTINVMIGEESVVSHNTTPDVVDLQKFLYRMKEAGCQYVVMEVSSHALALKRVAGIEYDTAALTNITEDHLDFHKTMEAYRDAKSLLFEHLSDGEKENKTAVFNTDEPASKVIEARTKAPYLTYGMGKENDIYPLAYDVEAKGMHLCLHTPAGEMDLQLNITGKFNVYNVMCAVGALLAEKIDKAEIEKALNGFAGVPGRFQLVEAGQPYTVIVDYAHTPDGLENVLNTARLITKGRLWVVFGCGGDRDNKKRPIMGEIALRLADDVVVTSDNPRSEDPEKIIDQIEIALKPVPEGKSVTRIADRKAAIEYALAHAGKEDVIMVAGKGHENYQILKDKTIHFDDKEVVEEYWKGKQA
ncbi:MAG: UDP-N-acetylmuramoyl-L-alanyl-D-glutamate--2,6-diaminopimelate ligase [Acidaminococcaceae bacterium]|nr:UDP-N-acetylmuramoyl-L-alanyl-D-glutamate--2,6-diaminopimelate ligase [Acidaminococcaceae bacterium]